MKRLLTVIGWLLALAAVYLAAPIGAGIAGAFALHGDHSLKGSELVHWLIVIAGILPAALWPWFLKKEKMWEKLLTSILSLLFVIMIEFFVGLSTACGVYGACP